jgi:hypothetical protein
VPPVVAAYKVVTADQLSDVTTLVNIVQRVAGALGGEIFVKVLATTSPHGLPGAFHTVFGAMAALALLAAASALAMLRTTMDGASSRPPPRPGGVRTGFTGTSAPAPPGRAEK